MQRSKPRPKPEIPNAIFESHFRLFENQDGIYFKREQGV
jgi:hypothetical protein